MFGPPRPYTQHSYHPQTRLSFSGALENHQTDAGQKSRTREGLPAPAREGFRLSLAKATTSEPAAEAGPLFFFESAERPPPKSPRPRSPLPPPLFRRPASPQRSPHPYSGTSLLVLPLTLMFPLPLP